jgi:hypothetical protein
MTVTAIREEASRGIMMSPPFMMTAIMSLGIKVTRLFHTLVSFAGQALDRCA